MPVGNNPVSILLTHSLWHSGALIGQGQNVEDPANLVSVWPRFEFPVCKNTGQKWWKSGRTSQILITKKIKTYIRLIHPQLNPLVQNIHCIFPLYSCQTPRLLSVDLKSRYMSISLKSHCKRKYWIDVPNPVRKYRSGQTISSFNPHTEFFFFTPKRPIKVKEDKVEWKTRDRYFLKLRQQSLPIIVKISLKSELRWKSEETIFLENFENLKNVSLQ